MSSEAEEGRVGERERERGVVSLLPVHDMNNERVVELSLIVSVSSPQIVTNTTLPEDTVMRLKGQRERVEEDEQ